MPCVRALLSIVSVLALCLVVIPPAGAGEPDDAAVARTKRLEREAVEHDAAGRHAEAVLSWKKVLAARPGDPWTRRSLATSLRHLATPESLREAETLLVALAKLDWVHPTRGDVRFEVDDALAAVLSSRAEKFEGEERARLLRRAITAWERVLTVHPRYPGALLGLAQAHIALQRDEAGSDYAERYLALCRESRRRWEQQQGRWLAAVGQTATPEQSRLFTEKIERARRNEEEVLLLLASMHRRRKEPKKALARYNAILDSGQASCAAYFGRAQAYVALDRFESAVKDLERCLDLAKEGTRAGLRKSAAELLERCRQSLRKGAPPR